MSTIFFSAFLPPLVGDINSRQLSFESIAPAPILLSGNPSCADLNANAGAQYAFIVSNNELKLDFTPPSGNSGPYPFTNGAGRSVVGPTDAANSVSLQSVNAGLDTFNFTSTRPITAVIVKGGPNSNVYLYPPSGTLGGNPDGLGLTTPSAGPAVSHISFCFAPAAQVTIVKEVETFSGGTSSTTSFPFTATNFGTANFSLVDDNGGPGNGSITNSNVTSFGGGGNTITVTESLVSGWTLADLDCVESMTQNTTINFGARRADMIAEPGEKITCTFKNLQLAVTAANAAMGGRVLTESGAPIRGATVTLYNANTLETKTYLSSSLGYFTFSELPVNHFYILTVSHGKYSFPNNTQTFTLLEDLTEMNFTSFDGTSRSPILTGRKGGR